MVSFLTNVCIFVGISMVINMFMNWYLDSRTPDLNEVMKEDNDV